MSCGYDWTALFVGVLVGVIVTTGFFGWFFSWACGPMEMDDEIPTLTDEVEVER